MKKLESLGISPTPWKVDCDKISDSVLNILDANGKIIVETDAGFYPPGLSDARMMMAAPELYECLHEAACNYCKHCHGVRGECPEEHGACTVQKWRAALAKAAGEDNSTNKKGN